jgi:putative transposase
MLAKTFGSARYVYNYALNLRSSAWRERQQRVSYGDTSSALTALKRQPETAWLNDVSCIPLQQSLRHLQSAFSNFWRHGTKYPKFKTKGGTQTAEFTRSGFKWRSGELTLSKIGKTKIRWSRHFHGDPTSVHVSHTTGDRYYISFSMDEPVSTLPEATGQIGIDLGLTAFAAFSDGSKVHAPRPLRRKTAQLRRAHKALSRKKFGSANRNKARIRLARVHEKISHIRCDALHKLTIDLVRKNHTIVIEDLYVRGLMANHKLAQAISDSGWSEFARQLTYKTKWYGRILIRADRWYPSSQVCSACGFQNATLLLKIREWECPSCGENHDRDLNAAKNILAAGLADNQNACGDSVRPIGTTIGNRPRSRNRSVLCA